MWVGKEQVRSAELELEAERAEGRCLDRGLSAHRPLERLVNLHGRDIVGPSRGSCNAEFGGLRHERRVKAVAATGLAQIPPGDGCRLHCLSAGRPHLLLLVVERSVQPFRVAGSAVIGQQVGRRKPWAPTL